MILAPLLAGALAGPVGEAARAEAYFNYCLARQAYHRQELPLAIELLEKAVLGDPASGDLAAELAHLYLDLNDPEAAARSAEKAVGLAPASATAWRALATARTMLAERDGSPAARDASRAALAGLLAREPDDSGALFQLARIELARNDPEAAMAALRRLLAIAPDMEEAIVLASHALSRQGRFDEAVGTLLEAISRNDDSPALRLALVEAHEASGDLEEALLVAARLATMRVDPVRVEYLMARLCAKADRHAEAYEHWTRIATIVEERDSQVSASDRAEVHARRIESLLNAGRPAEAIPLAEAGEHRFPDDPRFRMRRSEALLLLGKEAEAQRALATSLAAGADPVLRQMASDVYLSAGARRERAGEFRQAERLLRKAIEVHAENASALNYLGYMYAERGEKLDESLDLIRRALARDPDNGAYLDSLGWAHFRRGEFEKAEAALLKALEHLSAEPAIHEHLGELYLATGRYGHAIESLQRAIDGGAERPDALRERIAAARKAAASTP